MTETLITYARQYIAHGFNVLRTDGKKAPVCRSWRHLQEKLHDPETLEAYFKGVDLNYRHDPIEGLGVICGKVSGNLEVIDVDIKNAHDPENLFIELVQAITDLDPELFPKLVVAQTPSGGYHIYYRCPEVVIPGNKKLSGRPATEAELKDNPNCKVLFFLETRGEGGYVAAAPSKGYEFVKNKVSEVPNITAAERDTLWAAVLSFNEYIQPAYIPAERTPQKSFGKSPFDDYNERGDIIGLLTTHGWTVVRERGERIVFKRPGNTDSKSSGDFHRGLNLFSVFTTNSPFEPQKGYRPAAVYAILECNGDFKAAARKLLDQGYGTRKRAMDRQMEEVIRTAKEKGQEGSELITTVAMAAGIPAEEAARIIADFENNAGVEIRTFWTVNPRTLKPTIMLTRLEQFLTSGGYGLYFYGYNRTIFKLIRDDHGIIEEVSTEAVKKYVKAYVDELPGSFDDITRDDLLEVVYRSNAFTENLYEYLPRLDIQFLKDTKDTAFYPFRNGIAIVTAGSVEVKSYGELGKSVWRSAVITHDIEIIEDIDPEGIEFYRFLKAICNDDRQRIEYIMQVIGYLLHGYKDPARSYCIVLAEETDDEAKGGGTGKGIFFKALGKLVPQLIMDGKNFKHDKSFLFQRVQLDHRQVVIDDVRARIDFEGFYSIITEGFTIEKKNKDELYIPYKDSPKIIFSTNYAIPASADHARRRQRVVEFAKRFTPEYTPRDMFGHVLFDDWDEAEWNRFYNLLFACVQQYLIEGVVDREASEASRRKQIKVQFTEEFFTWFQDYFTNGCEQVTMFSEKYENFINTSSIDRKDYSVKRFKKALTDSCKLFGAELLSRKNSQAAGKIEIWVKKQKESGTEPPIIPDPF